MAEIRVLNDRGEWVQAIPLPLFLPVRKQCVWCGVRFLREKAYRGHYALVHILHLREE